MKLNVWQCKHIAVTFCKHGGSSSAIRAFQDSSPHLEFTKANPQLQLSFSERNGRHPTAVAHYVDDRLMRDGSREPKQVSLRYVEDDAAMIERLSFLRNQHGTKSKKMNGDRQWRKTDSIQGVWTPTTVIN